MKAGSTYVSSYGTKDNYANTTYYFGTSSTSNSDGTLKLPGGRIGVFNDNLGAFPRQSWHSTNYWADVVFKASATGAAVAAAAPGLVLTGRRRQTISLAVKAPTGFRAIKAATC